VRAATSSSATPPTERGYSRADRREKNDASR